MNAPDDVAARIAAQFRDARRAGLRVSLDAWLQSSIGGQELTEVRSRVLACLSRNGAVATGLSGQGDAVAVQCQPDEWPTLEGYAIVDQVGRGGMGIVYEAYQLATGRRIAIKFMRPELAAHPLARLRFEREVELVARLHHPSIVAVIDSGVHRGSYYYAMDFIDGCPLDVAISCGRGAISETLSLLAEICEAVEHAHQHGVLHRDLKPSNVLIDEAGRPHVVDFGLAKTVDLSPGVRADVTLSEPGQLIGTLAYMAPEQAGGAPGAATARSDVYALGVIGFQLLTGVLPCDPDGSLDQVLHRIRHVDPPVPSAVRREINADINAILLKALEKQPERRYSSAGHMAEDLRRAMAHEPVLARPADAWYQLRKFARRHRLIVFSAAAVLLALNLGIAATGIALARESRQRARAELAERQASRRFNELRRLSNTLLHDLHDQIADLSGSTPARKLLVQTALEYLNGLTREAGDDIGLRQELADAYRRIGDVQGNAMKGRGHLGDSEGAIASYEKALEIANELAASQPGNFSLQLDVARCRESVSDMHFQVGRIGDARDGYALALEEALACQAAADIARRATELAVLLRHKLGDACLSLGQLDAAEEQYTRAHQVQTAVAQSSSGDRGALQVLVLCENRMGRVHMSRNRLSEARMCFQKALSIRRDLATSNKEDARARRDLSVSLLTVGELLMRMGDMDAALRHCQEARDIDLSLAAADPGNLLALDDVAVAHQRCCEVLAFMGRFEEAHRECESALKVRERAVELDPENDNAQQGLAAACVATGRLLMDAGQPSEALTAFNRAVQVLRNRVAAGPENLNALRNLTLANEGVAEVLLMLERRKEALAVYRENLEISRRLRDASPGDWQIEHDCAISHDQLGDVLLADGRFIEALSHFTAFNEQCASLFEAQPLNSMVARSRAVSFAKLAWTHGALADQETLPSHRLRHLNEAAQHYSRAMELLDQLGRARQLDSRDQQILAHLADELRDCKATISEVELQLTDAKGAVD